MEQELKGGGWRVKSGKTKAERKVKERGRVRVLMGEEICGSNAVIGIGCGMGSGDDQSWYIYIPARESPPENALHVTRCGAYACTYAPRLSHMKFLFYCRYGTYLSKQYNIYLNKERQLFINYLESFPLPKKKKKRKKEKKRKV